MEQPFLTLHI